MHHPTHSCPFAALICFALVSSGIAQIPSPAATKNAHSAIPTASPAATASAMPSTATLINSMDSADLEQAIALLKNNYLNPEALSETELNRAMLEGLLVRLGRGVMLLPDRQSQPLEVASLFYSEILEGHVGYLRLGAFNKTSLQAMDTNLQTFASKKVDAIIVDLRASPQTNDFAIAAEFTKRFAQKGKPLFTLRKPAMKEERVFTSDQNPTYKGFMMVLADGDTTGAAEAVAGVLRLYDKAMIIGQTTAGRAVEYSDLPLPSGKILRVAVGEAVLPGGRPLFPEGVRPDLPVPMSVEEKRQIFQQSFAKGLSEFVFETDRPHMNEAALLAGKNPEIEALQQRPASGPKQTTLRDPVLQRALDLVTSISIYQKQSGGIP